MSHTPVKNGAEGLDHRVELLASRLPDQLRALARVAYNYRWSWTRGGDSVFNTIDPARWNRLNHNPIRMLVETPPGQLARAAEDPAVVEGVERIARQLDEDLDRPVHEDYRDAGHIAFLCAEFGVHRSLPIYSGGLGVLAGDILKEASDLALPMVAVGLFYRRGYFHQRLDSAGWQHEYWVEVDPDLLPTTQVLAEDGAPLVVSVPVRGREVDLHVWRVDVGRVPLFLLDADVETNDPVDRWITARLYDGNNDIRLAQYTVLGIGAMRALRAVKIEPSLLHLNEGHASLAAMELAVGDAQGSVSLDHVRHAAHDRVVFTTHTPVAAGNETYPVDQLLTVMSGAVEELGIDRDEFVALGRVNPDDHDSQAGMTPMAIRLARHVNGVSRRHGEVARDMWAPLFRRQPAEVPIDHVTNGVHIPTWMGEPMRTLLDQYLDDGWHTRTADPATWEPVERIPDAQLWAARTESRRILIDYVRDRLATDRLGRGEDVDSARQAIESLDPEILTIGFARRVAAYKRLHLLRHDPERVVKLLDDPHPLQLLFAGKAHPADDGAKAILKSMFDLRGAPRVSERVSFLEDYGLASGAMLTMGCDVWVNVPRPPLEASGTSGIKSSINGGLNLSVLDGWWAEGYNGTNGWAISGDENPDVVAQDEQHADQLYRLLEEAVVPTFYERDADGVPTRWVAMARSALRNIGPQFSASRMMHDYMRTVYTAREAR